MSFLGQQYLYPFVVQSQQCNEDGVVIVKTRFTAYRVPLHIQRLRGEKR